MFTSDTPAEFITALLTDLVNPELLDTDRDDDDPHPALAVSSEHLDHT